MKVLLAVCTLYFLSFLLPLARLGGAQLSSKPIIDGALVIGGESNIDSSEHIRHSVANLVVS